MRGFLSITVVMTVCFLATDALFLEGRYRAEIWKDASVQFVGLSRSARRTALSFAF
jgi:hypothetical protein